MAKIKKSYYDGMTVSQQQLARSNKIAVICHAIEATIIALAYFLEYFKHTRILSYVIVVAILAFIPIIIEFILLIKNKCSKLVKHFISFGFGGFYTFILLTSDNKLAFVYVIPLLVIITAYADVRYCATTGICAWIVNVIQIVILYTCGITAKGQKFFYTSADSATVEIQLLGLLLIVIYMIVSTYANKKNGKVSMAEIEKQSGTTSALLDNILNVTTAMVTNIDDSSAKIEELSDKVNATKDAMGEVNAGSSDTAEAVQKQLDFTAEISEKVDSVDEGTKSIASSVEMAKSAVEEGSKNVEELVAQVKESVDNGKLVKEQLERLNVNMEEMKQVIDIIDNIASQTGLLALNASIEAARAGEAGRGFAVVASEISKMSGETENATDTIKRMIAGITKTIIKVVEVTSSMVEMIESQSEVTEATANSFTEIEESTNTIIEQSAKLQTYVEELAVANKEIVDSISTISAITEEVSAHASSTFMISEQNAVTVAEVVALSEQLKELANDLKND